MEKRLTPYEAVTKIEGSRVLVLAPHPDDEVFGCSGAIMRHVIAGDLLQIVILSDGEYRADTEQQAAYGKLRREESNKAAATLTWCMRPPFMKCTPTIALWEWQHSKPSGAGQQNRHWRCMK